MKFSACSLLALCAFQGASAFVAKAPNAFAVNRQVSQDTRLQMSELANVWDKLTPVLVQGGSLKTWSFQTPAVESVQVMLRTEGRPLNANVDLWQGPDNTPQKMSVYLEDGSERQFNAVIKTPRGQNTVAIRNTAALEFPLEAVVEAGMKDVDDELADKGTPEIIQGGAIRTYAFNPSVASVQVLLKTDGRPLNARVELMQGPNNNKQVIELYTENGLERPFFAMVESPGSGNVVRVINTAPVEFPLTASVEAAMFDEAGPDDAVIISDGSRSW